MWAHPWDVERQPGRGRGTGGRGTAGRAPSNRPIRNPVSGALHFPGEAPAKKAAPSQPVISKTAAPPTDHPASRAPTTLAPPLKAVEGPFDNRRTGERVVRPPDSIPEAMRYAPCATAVALPAGLDASLVAASATPPQHQLLRARVCGYNGTGAFSRAPNLNALALPSARERVAGGGGASEVAYAAGRLVVLADVDTGAQRCYEAHTQIVTCLAIHPRGTARLRR